MTFHVGEALKQAVSADAKASSLRPPFRMLLIWFKAVLGQLVETIHDPVSESVEIVVAIGQLEDLLDIGVPAFHRAIGYPGAIASPEGIGDFVSP